MNSETVDDTKFAVIGGVKHPLGSVISGHIDMAIEKAQGVEVDKPGFVEHEPAPVKKIEPKAVKASDIIKTRDGAVYLKTDKGMRKIKNKKR